MAETTPVPVNEVHVEEDSAPVETEADGAGEQDETTSGDEFDEFGEELIIEDFTIDGICGVY
jgi:mycofactocin precursor